VVLLGVVAKGFVKLGRTLQLLYTRSEKSDPCSYFDPPWEGCDGAWVAWHGAVAAFYRQQALTAQIVQPEK